MGDKIDRKYNWAVKWMNKTCRSWEAPSVFLKSWTRPLLRITTLDLSNSGVIESKSAVQWCDFSWHSLLYQTLLPGSKIISCHTSTCCVIRKLLSPTGSLCLFPHHFVPDAWAAFHYVSSHIRICLTSLRYWSYQSEFCCLPADCYCSIAAVSIIMVGIFYYMQAHWHRKARTTL